MARIAFLHDLPFEYPGILSLVAYIQKSGHEADVFIQTEEGRHFWDKIKEFKPDWVGLSAVVGNHTGCFKLARTARDKLGVGTVFGGLYTSFYPNCIEREEVDVLIRGEGEEALLDLLNAYEKHEDYSHILNLWTKRNGSVVTNPVRPFETELDKYPVTDRYYYYKYPKLRDSHFKYFMTGRGCPFNCAFCFNQVFRKLYNYQGHEVRRYSPKHVLEELIHCKERYPMKRIVFADDIFLIQRKWLMEFLPRYKKEIGVPFSCNVRADMIVSEDMVRLLRESGCDYVQVGLESGNDRIRNEILGKRFSNEQFCEAADLLHRYGIKIKSFNIIGSPTETLEEALDTMELNSRARIEYPLCALYQPYEGTKTDEIARKLGCVDDASSTEDIAGFAHTKSSLVQPEIKELERAQKLFYLGARNHRLIPLIRKIVHYNLGPIFTFVFFVTFFIRYMQESGDNLLHSFLVGGRYIKRNVRILLDRAFG